jgi:transposase
MDNAWAGIDAGKEFHWARVVGIEGETLLSRKVENDEADLRKLIGEVLPLAEEITWATDQPGGTAALLLALLWERNQKVIYIPVLPWIEPATPIAESPRPMLRMPMSSPTRPA